jgi:hypothetical protein
VSFFWREREGIRLEGNGFTRDVSERGVFVLTDTQAPLGEAIQLEIVFCSPGTNSMLRMIAKGQVLRVEPGSRSAKTGGFGAATSPLVLSNCLADGRS